MLIDNDSQRDIGREVLSDLRSQIPLIIYTVLALFTRLYRIGANNTVVWDEVRASHDFFAREKRLTGSLDRRISASSAPTT